MFDQFKITDYAVIISVLLFMIDGLMAIYWWEFETNPILLSIGTWGMVALKLSTAVALLWIWFSIDGHQSTRTSRFCVWFFMFYYAFMLGLNIGVLL